MSPEIEEEGCAGCKPTPKWRQDFPIEWEGDHYVSRREMVKFLTLGSLLLASGELGDGAGQQVSCIAARMRSNISAIRFTRSDWLDVVSLSHK